MNFIKRYLLPRLIQSLLVILVGTTVVFLVPRLSSTDPVQKTLSEMRARGTYLEPGQMDEIIADMTQMYGLEGSWLQQYGDFWVRLFHLDFGVSFFQFPARVNDLIFTALPWTLGLMLSTTLISWIVGCLVGGLAGYFSKKSWSKVLDTIAMLVRPLPYYIFAFALLLLFAYFIRLFPVSGGATLGRDMTKFNWELVKDVLWHSALPAISMMALSGATMFQTMKLMVQNVNAENFVQYAKLSGVTENRIVSKYVIRNAILPQITGLALSLGQIFSGALITEIVFTYPGLGNLLYKAIINGDYNLIMGITLFSILAITIGILVVDLIYPLFDPRVRYS